MLAGTKHSLKIVYSTVPFHAYPDFDYNLHPSLFHPGFVNTGVDPRARPGPFPGRHIGSGVAAYASTGTIRHGVSAPFPTTSLQNAVVVITPAPSVGATAGIPVRGARYPQCRARPAHPALAAVTVPRQECQHKRAPYQPFTRIPANVPYCYSAKSEHHACDRGEEGLEGSRHHRLKFHW